MSLSPSKKIIQHLSIREKSSLLTSHGFFVDFYPNFEGLTSNFHQLDVILISYVAKGEIEHQIENQCFTQKAGSIGITSYHQNHIIRENGKKADIYNIFLDPSKSPLPNMGEGLNQILSSLFPQNEHFSNNSHGNAHIEIQHREELHVLLERSLREIHDMSLGYLHALTSMKHLILLEICRSAQAIGTTSFFPSISYPPWFDPFLTWIDQHYLEPLTLKIMAKHCGFSESYLSKTFKRVIGKSIVDHLIDRRIQTAMMLLSNTSAKVMDIALDSGFEELTYFNRTFKKRVGLSPREFRQRKT